MEEYALIEADFQQYYTLDLSERARWGFQRYARLFINLPVESRTIRHYSPAVAWTWQDEVQSRILHEISALIAVTINMNRKPGSPPIKPDKQFQPEAVEEAKKVYDKERRASSQYTEEDMKAIREFWERKNKNTS